MTLDDLGVLLEYLYNHVFVCITRGVGRALGGWRDGFDDHNLHPSGAAVPQGAPRSAPQAKPGGAPAGGGSPYHSRGADVHSSRRLRRAPEVIGSVNAGRLPYTYDTGRGKKLPSPPSPLLPHLLL
ncbi:unnamed protein product [Ascophyllum nodosum]